MNDQKTLIIMGFIKRFAFFDGGQVCVWLLIKTNQTKTKQKHGIWLLAVCVCMSNIPRSND